MNYKGQKAENYQIRNAVENDISRIKQIELESGISDWKIEEYLDELARKDSIFWVCELEKEVVGFTIMRLIMNGERYVPFLNSDSKSEKSYIKIEEIEIFSIAIRKDFRKLGLATKLLEKIIAENPDCRIHLEVRASNVPAINFYKRHNFNIVNKRSNYYTLPMEDALIMMSDPGNKKSKLDYDKG